MANTRNRTSDVNALTSHNGPHPHPQPEITLESIQRMISEGVKAQYMQTHYSMRPGYVKPYPSEVDMYHFRTTIANRNLVNLMGPDHHMNMWPISLLRVKI